MLGREESRQASGAFGQAGHEPQKGDLLLLRQQDQRQDLRQGKSCQR